MRCLSTSCPHSRQEEGKADASRAAPCHQKENIFPEIPPHTILGVEKRASGSLQLQSLVERSVYLEHSEKTQVQTRGRQVASTANPAFPRFLQKPINPPLYLIQFKVSICNIQTAMANTCAKYHRRTFSSPLNPSNPDAFSCQSEVLFPPAAGGKDTRTGRPSRRHPNFTSVAKPGRNFLPGRFLQTSSFSPWLHLPRTMKGGFKAVNTKNFCIFAAIDLVP